MAWGAWIDRAGLLVLAVGIGVRLARYLDQRTLWQDEVFLAINVLTRTPLGFLQPLANRQFSPLGFLWGEWVMAHVAGGGERSLRFLPLIGSIIGLIAFARLARRVLEPNMALLATTLAACSPLLIYYAAELKSYGLDFLFAVLLMHATLNLLEGQSRRAWFQWAAVAALGALFTTSAPFFVAGCAASLLVAAQFRRPRALLHIAAACLPAAIVFGVHLVTTYDSEPIARYMKTYWTEFFLVTRLPDALVQAVSVTRTFLGDVLFGRDLIDRLPRKSMTLMVACFAIGALSLVRRRSAAPWFLLLPIGLAAVASLVRQWPLTARLLLFAVPAVLILLPAGLAALVRVLPARYRGAVIAVPSVVLVGLAASGLGRKFQVDVLFADMPQALRKLSERTGPAATIYFSAELEAACIYYLRYHPEHATLRNDSSTRGCVIDGANMLIGSWPEYVGVRYGSATERERVVGREWLAMEGQWLLDQPPRDLVVLVGYMPDLRNKLPAWLERAGAKRVAEERMPGLLMVTYRLPALVSTTPSYPPRSSVSAPVR